MCVRVAVQFFFVKTLVPQALNPPHHSELLRDEMNYGKWFYGFLHDNRKVMDNHYLLFEQITRIA